MALIACKECRAEVSQTAEACPQCGAKVGMQGMARFAYVVMAFIALGIVVLQITKQAA